MNVICFKQLCCKAIAKENDWSTYCKKCPSKGGVWKKEKERTLNSKATAIAFLFCDVVYISILHAKTTQSIQSTSQAFALEIVYGDVSTGICFSTEVYFDYLINQAFGTSFGLCHFVSNAVLDMVLHAPTTSFLLFVPIIVPCCVMFCCFSFATC